MKYKVLICDVDGTLIPNMIDGRPSARVKKAIEQAKEKLFVGIATARSFTQLNSLFNDISFTAPCVITGGAQIYDPLHKSFYSEKLLTQENISHIYTIAQQM